MLEFLNSLWHKTLTAKLTNPLSTTEKFILLGERVGKTHYKIYENFLIVQPFGFRCDKISDFPACPFRTREDCHPGSPAILNKAHQTERTENRRTVLILFKWLDQFTFSLSTLEPFFFHKIQILSSLSLLWCSSLNQTNNTAWLSLYSLYKRTNVSKKGVICWMTWKRRWFILITLLFKPHRTLKFQIVWCFPSNTQHQREWEHPQLNDAHTLLVYQLSTAASFLCSLSDIDWKKYSNLFKNLSSSFVLPLKILNTKD